MSFLAPESDLTMVGQIETNRVQVGLSIYCLEKHKIKVLLTCIFLSVLQDKPYLP